MKLEKVTEYVSAATSKDDHGHTLSEDDLKRKVVDPVSGDFAGAYRQAHDRSLPPCGKVIAGRLAKEDGVVKAYSTAAPYKASGKSVTLADGTKLLEEVCTEDSRPVIGYGVSGFAGEVRIHVDAMDFSRRADFEGFQSEVKTIRSDSEVTCSVRKGLGAELIITLILSKIAEKLLDKGAEEAANAIAGSLQKLWRQYLESFKKHAKKDLQVCQNVVIDYAPIIELHCEDETPEAMCLAFELASLKNMIAKADECREKTKAARVHFKWINNEWKLYYVQTSDGQQFVTDTAQADREAQEAAMQKYIEENGLTGGHSINIEVKEPWSD